MLRIQRSANGKVVFTLSGRIEAGAVEELQRLFSLETRDRHLVLDLKDVTLVDRDAVKYLARCEANSIELKNCPAYIREWIDRERGRNARRNRQTVS
jgi:anti-anti-sigma regulatory factor